jgi:DNA primase
VLTIPNDEDPDDFVKARGPQAFVELLNQSSKDYMDFVLDKIAADFDVSSPSGKIAAIDILRPLVNLFSDSVVRQKFLKLIVEKLSLTPEIVYNKIMPGEYKHVDDDPIESYFGSIEGTFIHFLLSAPNLIPEARQFILPETFTDQFSSKLYSMILKSFDENAHLDTLLKNVDDETKRLISFALASNAPSDSDKLNESFIHIMRRVQEKYLQFQIRVNKDLIRKEPSKNAFLLKKNIELSLQLKALTEQ